MQNSQKESCSTTKMKTKWAPSEDESIRFEVIAGNWAQVLRYNSTNPKTNKKLTTGFGELR